MQPTGEQVKTAASRRPRTAAYYAVSVLCVLTALLVVLLLIFRPCNVQGHSMSPTLSDGEKLLLNCWDRTPERGDIVAVRRDDGIPLIKRVIAVEGDTVEISSETGAVLLNGQVLSETYTSGLTSREGLLAPITVPKGQVFLLGDNRVAGQSLDSRSFGCVSVDSIIGTAVYRFAPWEKRGGF